MELAASRTAPRPRCRRVPPPPPRPVLPAPRPTEWTQADVALLCPTQITAEQLLREAADFQEKVTPKPKQRIEDFEELHEYRARKRQEFEEIIRRTRSNVRPPPPRYRLCWACPVDLRTPLRPPSPAPSQIQAWSSTPTGRLARTSSPGAHSPAAVLSRGQEADLLSPASGHAPSSSALSTSSPPASGYGSLTARWCVHRRTALGPPLKLTPRAVRSPDPSCRSSRHATLPTRATCSTAP